MKKIWYLDNLRLVLAIFVVAWHAANAYIGINWTVTEATESSIVQFFKTFFDAITMPLFFYISGYFAFSSLRKHSSAKFLKGKVKTILLPWILSILLIIPFIEMIGRISKNAFHSGYWNLWKTQMNSFLEFNLGLVENNFYQKYMWFLSLLFFFFLIYGIIYRITGKPTLTSHKDVSEKKFNGRSTTGFFFKISLLSFIAMLAIFMIVIFSSDSSDPEPFFSFFNIIQFQSTRLPVYILYFVLGIYTNRNQWISRGLFTNSKLWNILFIVTGVFYLFTTNYLIRTLPEEIFGLLFIITINFFIAASLGFSMSFFKARLNKPVFGNEKISSHAFNIYIIHYIFAHLLQLAFLHVEVIPLSVKFVLVTCVSLILSYFTSLYALKPYPRATAFAGILITIVLFIFN